jgi:hypothetical protein
MKESNLDSIPCTECGGETKLTYGPENIEMIKKRVLESVEYFLVLCKNKRNEIVGFEEGYIDSLEHIFEWDLAYHYKNV